MGHFEEPVGRAGGEDIVFIVMLAGNGEIDGILIEPLARLTNLTWLWLDNNNITRLVANKPYRQRRMSPRQLDKAN